jgi:hypothetical protein
MKQHVQIQANPSTVGRQFAVLPCRGSRSSLLLLASIVDASKHADERDQNQDDIERIVRQHLL